jgi:uncharacterized protein
MTKTPDDPIDYGRLIDESMHDIVRRTLKLAEQHGLSHEHHFYISFMTDYPGVSITDRLKEKYPEEMTIVLQYQYWDLIVTDTQFSVVLSFENVKNSLVIPYKAITSFADPSVKFGLQFRHAFDVMEAKKLQDHMQNATIKAPSIGEEMPDGEPPRGSNNNVVALDSFRKKKK